MQQRIIADARRLTGGVELSGIQSLFGLRYDDEIIHDLASTRQQNRSETAFRKHRGTHPWKNRIGAKRWEWGWAPRQEWVLR